MGPNEDLDSSFFPPSCAGSISELLLSHPMSTKPRFSMPATSRHLRPADAALGDPLSGPGLGFPGRRVLRTQTCANIATRRGVEVPNAGSRVCAQNSPMRSAPAASYLRVRCAEPASGERGLSGPGAVRAECCARSFLQPPAGREPGRSTRFKSGPAGQRKAKGLNEQGRNLGSDSKASGIECLEPRGPGGRDAAGRRDTLEALGSPGRPEFLQPPPPASLQPSRFRG